MLGPVTVKLSANSHMLDVEVKQGQNVYSCVEKERIQNLGYQGRLGITAANRDEPLSSIDVLRTQFWNMSPAHYRKEEAKEPNSAVEDDIFDYEAIDLLHKKDPEAARKAYIK